MVKRSRACSHCVAWGVSMPELAESIILFIITICKLIRVEPRLILIISYGLVSARPNVQVVHQPRPLALVGTLQLALALRCLRAIQVPVLSQARGRAHIVCLVVLVGEVDFRSLHDAPYHSHDVLYPFLLRVDSPLLFNLLSPDRSLIDLNTHQHLILVILDLLLFNNTSKYVVKVSRHIQDLTFYKE
jgi:hypothetical protein